MLFDPITSTCRPAAQVDCNASPGPGTTIPQGTTTTGNLQTVPGETTVPGGTTQPGDTTTPEGTTVETPPSASSEFPTVTRKLTIRVQSSQKLI